MSDEADKPDEAQPTVTEPAPEKAESQVKTFTQEQLDAIVTKEKAKTERRVRKEMETPKPEPTPAAKSEPKVEKDPDVVALMQKLAFSEALEDLDWKPGKEDRETLRDMFLAKGAEGMEKLANRLKPPAPTVPVAKVDTPAPTPGVPTPAVRTPGAPAAVPVAPDDIPLNQLSQDDISRMQREGKWLAYLQRNGRGDGGGLFKKPSRPMPK